MRSPGEVAVEDFGPPLQVRPVQSGDLRHLVGKRVGDRLVEERVVAFGGFGPFIMSPLNCLSSSANHRCDGLPNSTAVSTCLTSVIHISLQRHP